jgi:hypothetical protein
MQEILENSLPKKILIPIHTLNIAKEKGLDLVGFVNQLLSLEREQERLKLLQTLYSTTKN